MLLIVFVESYLYVHHLKSKINWVVTQTLSYPKLNFSPEGRRLAIFSELSIAI